MSDLLRKYKSLYSSTTNTFSTGESVTITPASVVGLPTDTEITLTFDRVDSSGTKTPSKMERIRGTVVGSNFVVSSGGRAVEGTEQTHTSPVVEMVWNADDWNDMVDWGLVEHGQDGKHTDALVTYLKASGAVVNTGTSDVTIVTPKALADSDYIQNKDGWISANETWTYASATTITVPSGAGSIYQIGDKWKLTANSVVLQGYIIGVADELLTVTGDALTSHTFTSNYYSRAENPFGFPAKAKFYAHLSANQTVPQTTWTKISLNTELFDVGGNFNTTNYDFTAPYTGYYRLNGGVTFIGLNADSRLLVSIYKNGSFLLSSFSSTSITTDIGAHIGSIVNLAKGDTITLYVYQGTSGNEDILSDNTATFLSGEFIGV